MFIRGKMSSRFKIQDSRFKIQDSRFKIQDSRFKIQDSRFKIQDSRYNPFGLSKNPIYFLFSRFSGFCLKKKKACLVSGKKFACFNLYNFKFSIFCFVLNLDLFYNILIYKLLYINNSKEKILWMNFLKSDFRLSVR